MSTRTQNIAVAQIYTLWAEYAAAAQSGDLEGWIAFWSEESLQMPSDGERRIGKAAIQEHMAACYDLLEISSLNIEIEEVRVMGDRAYTHGTYEFMGTPKGGGEAQRYAGNFLDILAKQVDGSWKIAIDIHNQNSP